MSGGWCSSDVRVLIAGDSNVHRLKSACPPNTRIDFLPVFVGTIELYRYATLNIKQLSLTWVLEVSVNDKFGLGREGDVGDIFARDIIMSPLNYMKEKLTSP
ncbi:uncharacterized protein LOC127837173 [Dreissena polymorpha]|uniref:uncharacterized protein LOC127837173 n=1 Tax=Dreissena polymorpha TaxID=45954 RepID=UPI00226504ED|nr:uncharacterized protein LOC127837173 [Dreissena polymorpha]